MESGVYRVDRAEELEMSGSLVLRIAYGDKPVLMKNIGAALQFPDWCGANWDALEDCLSDLSWLPASGYVLVFEDAKPGDDLGVLVDVLRSATEWWAGRGKPFLAVFVDPARRLHLPELP
jgi:hypothetical protein